MQSLTELLSSHLALETNVVCSADECFLFFEIEWDVLFDIELLYVGPSVLTIFQRWLISDKSISFVLTLGDTAIGGQNFSTASIAPAFSSLASYSKVILPKCGMVDA